MQKIKLYFAGSWHKSSKQRTVGNRLISYAYPKQFDEWLELTGDKPGNLLVDSGAFSAWNKGKEIKLDDYIKYAHDVIERKGKKNVRIVNLDVIPGKVGETKMLNTLISSKETIQKNKNLINDAAKKGYMNLRRMKQQGITPIHVFHQGEQWKWLDKMVEQTDYIGISPANDLSNDERKAWIYSVFDYLHKNNIDVKTHGFAVWIPELLMNLPWTSCDAATWRLVAAWGGIYFPNRGFTDCDFSDGSKSYSILHVSERKNVKGLGVLTDAKLKLLEENGYTLHELQDFDVRAGVNVRFFLEMEKWLNNYKQNKEYIPKKRLLHV